METRVALLAPNDLNLRAVFAPRGEALRELVTRVESGRLSADAFAISAPRRFDAALARPFRAARSSIRRRRASHAAIGTSARWAVPTTGPDRPSWPLWLSPRLYWHGFCLTLRIRAAEPRSGCCSCFRSDCAPSRRAPGAPEPRVADLDDESLPVYSIIVPLHREAAIVPQLLAALGALDYPKAKLDVKFMLEAGDAATLAAVSRRGARMGRNHRRAAPGARRQSRERSMRRCRPRAATFS